MLVFLLDIQRLFVRVHLSTFVLSTEMTWIRYITLGKEPSKVSELARHSLAASGADVLFAVNMPRLEESRMPNRAVRPFVHSGLCGSQFQE